MEILIDGDILVYQATVAHTVYKVILENKNSIYFNTNKEAENYLKLNNFSGLIRKLPTYPRPSTVRTQLKNMVDDICYNVPVEYLEATKKPFIHTYHTIILKGDRKNYRYASSCLNQYKGNRQERPKQYELARSILSENNPVIYANGQETDDLLGIIQTSSNGRTIIASKDKDLLTIPGWNYNTLYKKLTYITEEEANRHFYAQLLIGDRADNITGAFGIGPVKAYKALANCRTPKQMALKVLDVYSQVYPKSFNFIKQQVSENGKLMYIRRKENELWDLEEVLK